MCLEIRVDMVHKKNYNLFFFVLLFIFEASFLEYSVAILLIVIDIIHEFYQTIQSQIPFIVANISP